MPAEAQDASPPMRPRSTSVTGTPRCASSKAIPVPMTPPPAMTTLPASGSIILRFFSPFARVAGK
jgi:hypothetical protein